MERQSCLPCDDGWTVVEASFCLLLIGSRNLMKTERRGRREQWEMMGSLSPIHFSSVSE